MRDIEILSELLNIHCLCAGKCTCSLIKLDDLNEIIKGEISGIELEIESLKERKKPFQILLSKIKPYIKQNKLRGSELLKAKGIEK